MLLHKQRMVNAILLIMIVTFSGQLFAAKLAFPKSISLKYSVTRNDMPFANIKEDFTVTGKSYEINSVTKGIGVYALFGERLLTSRGNVTSKGLQPTHFELHQGNSAKKTLITHFDWQNKQLNMQVKGQLRQADLFVGTQDLASYAYQFMYNPKLLKTPLKIYLTTGKRLKAYEYKVEPAKIKLNGKSVNTLHLTPMVQDDADEETKEFWLAKKYHYLPVKILVNDGNGEKLVQTLSTYNAN